MSDSKIVAFIKPEVSDGTEFVLEKNMVVTLPHPRNGMPALFIITTDKETSKMCIMEVQRGERSMGNCSAFINETVKSDASVTMLSLFDPLFFVLKYAYEMMEKSGKSFFQRDTVVDHIRTTMKGKGVPEAAFNDFGKLLRTDLVQSRISCVCSSQQEMMGDVIYTPSDELVLQELTRKVDRMIATIAPQGATGPATLRMPEYSFATSVTVGSSLNDQVKPSILSIKEHAFQNLKPLLPPAIATRLAEQLGLSAQEQPQVVPTYRPQQYDPMAQFDSKPEEVKEKKVESAVEKAERLHGKVQKTTLLSFFQKK